MQECAVCLGETPPAAELACCDGCGATAHRDCLETANRTCPKCSGRFSDELFFLPVTPGFDILLALTGAVAAIAALLLLGAIAGLVYAATNGMAFFYVLTFYFLPAACLFFVLGGLFAVTWFLRGEARRPQKIDA